MVDFLDGILSHIGDEEIAGGSIETEPPRIAEPVRPNFVSETGNTNVGIVERDRELRIGIAGVGGSVEPQKGYVAPPLDGIWARVRRIRRFPKSCFLLRAAPR